MRCGKAGGGLGGSFQKQAFVLVKNPPSLCPPLLQPEVVPLATAHKLWALGSSAGVPTDVTDAAEEYKRLFSITVI